MTREIGLSVGHYAVAQESCFRCGACSSLAPEVFAMEARGARVLRQPDTERERIASEAARLNCPGQAIYRVESGGGGVELRGGEGTTTSVEGAASVTADGGVGASGVMGKRASVAGGTETGAAGVMGMRARVDGGAEAGAGEAIEKRSREPLFPRLLDEAERVRWRITDIPWEAIEKDRVTPAFVRFVREVALSELTTFSATRRFLTEMADDADFTQWVSIWFYEETKHPEALLRWLACFGVTVEPREVLRGRVTAPFMRSRTGTLVTNILSELFASAGYQDLTRHTKEPVLAHITRCLAGDEARHGASFYTFAERAIANAKSPELERLQALKVLYYWVGAADHVEHPVNQFHAKVSADPELSEVLRSIGTDYGPALRRACRMIGTLIGKPLSAVEDVLPALREMSARLGQAG